MKLRDTIENNLDRAAHAASGEAVGADEFGEEKLRVSSMDGSVLQHVESLEVTAPSETGDSGSKMAEDIATEHVDCISDTLGSEEFETQYSKTDEVKVAPDNGMDAMEGELQHISPEIDQETQHVASIHTRRTGTVVKRSNEPGLELYAEFVEASVDFMLENRFAVQSILNGGDDGGCCYWCWNDSFDCVECDCDLADDLTCGDCGD